MSLDEMREALRAAGFTHLADIAERLMQPAICVEPTLVDEDAIPVGASKLGGHPDLPPSFAWPEHHGKSLTFLAQFNLAEVAPYDAEKVLPPSGMLYFFSDLSSERSGLSADTREDWRVIFAPELEPIARAAWPNDLATLHRLPSSRPDFSAALTLTEEPNWAAQLHLNDSEMVRFHDVVDSLLQADMRMSARMNDLDDEVEEDMEDQEGDIDDNDLVEDDEDDYEYKATRHQLLGHPLLVHYGGMPWVCERVSQGRPNPLFEDLSRTPYEQWDAQTKELHEKAYERWRLLFQVGNITGMPFPDGGEDDDDPVWKLSELHDTWARGGLLYFWIERDRLAQRDFSNVWMLGATQL